MEGSRPKQKSRGGLWWKHDRNGNKYLSGNIEVNGEKVYFSAFANTHKQEGERSPDFRIPEPQPRSETERDQQPARREPAQAPAMRTVSAEEVAKAAAAARAWNAGADEIPF